MRVVPSHGAKNSLRVGRSSASVADRDVAPRGEVEERDISGPSLCSASPDVGS